MYTAPPGLTRLDVRDSDRHDGVMAALFNQFLQLIKLHGGVVDNEDFWHVALRVLRLKIHWRHYASKNGLVGIPVSTRSKPNDRAPQRFPVEQRFEYGNHVLQGHFRADDFVEMGRLPLVGQAVPQ